MCRTFYGENSKLAMTVDLDPPVILTWCPDLRSLVKSSYRRDIFRQCIVIKDTSYNVTLLYTNLMGYAAFSLPIYEKLKSDVITSPAPWPDEG